MNQIPRRGSPGCALASLSLILMLLGVLLMSWAISNIIGERPDFAQIALPILFGLLFMAFALGTFKESIAPHSYQEFLPTEDAKGSDNLSLRENKILNEVKEHIRLAPSHDEMPRILKNQSGVRFVLANPKLR